MLAKPLTADRLERAINTHLGTAPTPQDADDIEHLLDPAVAKMPTTSWDERRDAAHYAVGSTGIVGFNQLSSVLSDAEEAAKQCDQEAMDELVSLLSQTLTK